MKIKSMIAAFASIIGMGTTTSQAAVVIAYTQTGSDVTVTISGSIDSFTGATLNSVAASAFNYNGVRGSDSSFNASDDPGNTADYDNYYVGTIPANLGTSNSTYYQPNSYDSMSTSFFMQNANPSVWIASNYVLGTAITGNMTYTNATFADIGLAVGDYTWDWGGDSITISVIPEPSTLIMCCMATSMLFIRRRRMV